MNRKGKKSPRTRGKGVTAQKKRKAIPKILSWSNSKGDSAEANKPKKNQARKKL